MKPSACRRLRCGRCRIPGQRLRRRWRGTDPVAHAGTGIARGERARGAVDGQHVEFGLPIGAVSPAYPVGCRPLVPARLCRGPRTAGSGKHSPSRPAASRDKKIPPGPERRGGNRGVPHLGVAGAACYSVWIDLNTHGRSRFQPACLVKSLPVPCAGRRSSPHRAVTPSHPLRSLPAWNPSTPPPSFRCAATARS